MVVHDGDGCAFRQSTPQGEQQRQRAVKLGCNDLRLAIGVFSAASGGRIGVLHNNTGIAAKVVRQAYHRDKLHWYVPPELAELDQQAVAVPERKPDSWAEMAVFGR